MSRSGEIAATGPGCAIATGQLVYVIPYLACGECVACRHGKTNCCQRTGVLGVHVDGGMADYICVPEHKQREHKLSTNGGKL
jgi:threonine dehydrogenase-like Zn-dependent dehydrogenase